MTFSRDLREEVCRGAPCHSDEVEETPINDEVALACPRDQGAGRAKGRGQDSGPMGQEE